MSPRLSPASESRRGMERSMGIPLSLRIPNARPTRSKEKSSLNGSTSDLDQGAGRVKAKGYCARLRGFSGKTTSGFTARRNRSSTKKGNLRPLPNLSSVKKPRLAAMIPVLAVAEKSIKSVVDGKVRCLPFFRIFLPISLRWDYLSSSCWRFSCHPSANIGRIFSSRSPSQVSGPG